MLKKTKNKSKISSEKIKKTCHTGCHTLFCKKICARLK